MSCQPIVTKYSCIVYKVNGDLLSGYDKYTSDVLIRISSSKVCTLVFYLAIVNKVSRHCHS